MTEDGYRRLLRKWKTGIRVIGISDSENGRYGTVDSVISVKEAWRNWPAAEPMLYIKWDRDDVRVSIYGLHRIDEHLRLLNVLEQMAEIE